jgi:5-methylcytosine-specific restriction endonuclease McrA
MIKLTKAPIPKVLADNAATWTATILDKYAAGEVPTQYELTRYRHDQIKDVLVAETNGKCAYCESKILHTQFGDIEHIFPRSLARQRTFEWENLTIACRVCNQGKTDRDPLAEHIIDPYLVDPEEHLGFVGALIFSRGTALGTSSRAILSLGRPELCERRKTHLERILGIYETIFRDDLPLTARKAIYEDLIANEGIPRSEYAAMTKAVINNMKEQLPEEFAPL